MTGKWTRKKMDLAKSKMQQRVWALTLLIAALVHNTHTITSPNRVFHDWEFMCGIAIRWLEYLLFVVGNQFMRLALASSSPSKAKIGEWWDSLPPRWDESNWNASNHQNENVFPLRDKRWIYIAFIQRETKIFSLKFFPKYFRNDSTVSVRMGQSSIFAHMWQ